MTTEMRAFLTSWLKWASSYSVDDNPSMYSPSMGLCAAASSYSEGNLEGTGKLSRELIRLFLADGLSTGYPFGFDAYYIRQLYSSQHECPSRLAWVRKQLETPE